MNSPQALGILHTFIRDAFYQARGSKVAITSLFLVGLAILFCLGISVDAPASLRAPDDPYDHFQYHPETGEPLMTTGAGFGKISFFFGVMKASVHRDKASVVHLVQVAMATWMAGTFGVLAALVWAASLLPEMLQPSQAATIFSKPTPRWMFLVGKFAGVMALVAAQSALFFIGTWAALGVRTGIWTPGYLLAIFVFLLHFGSFFAFSMLMAVMTRNTVGCVLGVVAFWAACVAVNFGRHTAVALPTLVPDAQGLSPLTMFLTQASYWALPGPIDFLVLLDLSISTDRQMATLSSVAEIRTVLESGGFDPILIIGSKLAYMAATLGLAGHQLNSIEV